MWWQKNPIYQIYPRSFKDTNGDGVGDLNGIIEKLDYLEWLGIKIVWLSPIYTSPMVDFGYDITDYRDIHPMFGDLKDFDRLIKEMHRRGMYLILDFVPNHTSDQHPWFKASVANDPKYAEYYVWREAKLDAVTGERFPPNNWLSVFGGSAWAWCPERKLYYLHQFLDEQPDLNYRNSDVRREMDDVLRFWLDRGVDGFRIDAVIYLMECDTFADNSLDQLATYENDVREKVVMRNVDQPETPEIVGDWVRLVRDYAKQKGREHVFVCTEGFTTLEHLIKYYDVGVDFPFNFSLLKWNLDCSAEDARRLIDDWLDASCRRTRGHWPNWVLGNHDHSRVCSRLGRSRYADMANALLMLLPGTPTCYQGDELGMLDVEVTFDQCRDPFGRKFGPDEYLKYTRDPCRSPMIWRSDESCGGFCPPDVHPWLPLLKEMYRYAVDAQTADDRSHLHFFRRLIKLRTSDPIFYQSADNFSFLAKDDLNFLVFQRTFDDGRPAYVIVLNLGNDEERRLIDLSTEVKGRAVVVLRSRCVVDRYAEGKRVDLSSIALEPPDALIMRIEYDD